MTDTTNQLPRPGHVCRWLRDSNVAAQQAAATLSTARALLQDAANADPSLKALSAELETLSASVESLAARISAEAQAEADRIEVHAAEVADLRTKATRRMFALHKEIDRAKAILKSKIDHDERRKAELSKAGLSAKEIARAFTPMSSSEVELAHAQIAAMEKERDACDRFVHDGPRFDPSLLAGTSLFPAASAEAA